MEFYQASALCIPIFRYLLLILRYIIKNRFKNHITTNCTLWTAYQLNKNKLKKKHLLLFSANFCIIARKVFNCTYCCSRLNPRREMHAQYIKTHNSSLSWLEHDPNCKWSPYYFCTSLLSPSNFSQQYEKSSSKIHYCTKTEICKFIHIVN